MAQFIIMDSPKNNTLQENIIIHDGDTIGNILSCNIFLTLASSESICLKISMHNDTTMISAQNTTTTFSINGAEVHSSLLSHGDILTIGDYMLLFNAESPEENTINNAIDDILSSQIESRMHYYQNTDHVLETFNVNNDMERHLVTLYKVSNTLSGILDLNTLLKRLLKILLDEFEADRAIILLYDSIRDKFTSSEALSTQGEIINPKISGSIVKEVLRTKESLLCENIMNDGRFSNQDSIISYNIKSAICVPLIRNDVILGLIQLESHKHGKFKKQHLELMTQIALQASIVIENAQFYRTKQTFQHNLIALSEATKSIASYLRQDLILQDTTYFASQIFQTSRCFLFLLENNILKIAYASGIDESEWKNIPIPRTIKNILTDSQSIFYNKQENMPEDIKAIANNKEALIAVPLLNNIATIAPAGSPFGVLCIINRSNAASYTLEDQQGLAILADYTATALSNANFYDAIKQKEQEIAQLNQELEQRVKERTKELEEAQQKLAQSEKMTAIGLLASGIAHEFNNIMASIYGFAQLAKKSERAKDKLVNIIDEQCNRACSLTERLLTFSKQTSDIMELTDLCSILNNILELTEITFQKEGVTIIKNYTSLPKTYVNINRIQQVFMNILINARHSIETTGKIIITATVSPDQKFIHISFKDTGQGIEQENLDRIFEPFYTTKGSFGSGTLPGHGIGLYICYNIVKQHGGDIKVTSQLGCGSCFTIILPLTQTNTTDSMCQETMSFQGIKRNTSIESILVIEDAEILSDLLLSVLEDKGFNTYSAKNASSTIELCKKEIFDYIFIDLKFISDENIFRQIKQLEPQAKVILITGRAEDSTLMQYRSQVDGYLRKPFDIDDIHRVFIQLPTTKA